MIALTPNLRLFINAITCVELSIKLATHTKSLQWNWFFRSFHQPHACALILLELGGRPPSDLVDRAWQAIEIFMEQPDLYRTGSSEMSEKYWRPLRKLKERALRNRASSQSPPVMSWPPGPGSASGSSVAGSSVAGSVTTSHHGMPPPLPGQQQQQAQQQHGQAHAHTIADSPIDWVGPLSADEAWIRPYIWTN